MNQDLRAYKPTKNNSVAALKLAARLVVGVVSVLLSFQFGAMLAFTLQGLTVLNCFALTLGTVALGVVLQRSPVQNLLCLIGVLLGMAMLYLKFAIEFLAYTFLIVYVGAIAILFLFVIMLLDMNTNDSNMAPTSSARITLLKTFTGVVALGYPTYVAFSAFFVDLWSHVIQKTLSEVSTTSATLVAFTEHGVTDIFSISNLLYGYYTGLFMLITGILLTAMIGAIILAMSTVESAESQC